MRRSLARVAQQSVPEAVHAAAPRPTDTPTPKAASAPGGPTAGQHVVTAFVALDGTLQLVGRRLSGERVVRSQRAEWASFLRSSDVTPELRRSLRDSRSVAGLHDEGEWVRVLWV